MEVLIFVVGICLGMASSRIDKRTNDLNLHWKVYMKGMEDGYRQRHLGGPELTYHNTVPPKDMKAWWKDLGL